MNRIDVGLWYDKDAEKAADFYASIFKNSKVGHKAYYGKSGSKISGQKEGSLMSVDFDIEGLHFQAINGGPIFKHTLAHSIYIRRKDEKEIDRLWEKLSKGGSVVWELKEYPWSKKYGWCKDKYGVPWQLIIDQAEEKILPAFLFTPPLYGRGNEALEFWMAQFKDSKISQISKNPADQTIMHAVFSLAGQEFVLMEGTHGRNVFNEAMSFIVNCKNQNEIDHYWKSLIADGGKESECGWVKDKFGVSWQVVPSDLNELMKSNDPVKVENVMSAMLKMKKLDIAKLKQAYQG